MIPMPESKKRELTQTPEDRMKFLGSLVGRSRAFLEEEISLPVAEVTYHPGGLEKLDLKNITSILTIEDCFKMIVAFSYERPLLDRIFRTYSEGLRIAPEEYLQLLEETAGDMINIVVGNALAEFQQSGYAFALSTPIIISEAKSILRYKKSELFTAELAAEPGKMTILCITPGSYYDKTLNVEAAQ